MNKVKFLSNERIFRQGDLSGCMYYILSGKVSIVVDNADGSTKELTTLGRKAYFGEMGIIDDAPRSATAIAVDTVEAVRIDKDSFEKFAKDNTADVVAMMKHLSSRIRSVTREYSKVMKDVSDYVDISENKGAKLDIWYKLSQMSKEAIRELSEVVSSESGMDTYKEGAIIFKKGQKGAFMYKIIEGVVSFYENYGSLDQIELSKLGRGDIFGELAVIDGEKRSADAVASTPVKLEKISNAQLETFLESNPDDAIRVLKNLTGKLRSVTDKYVKALKTIAECVADDKMSVDGSVWESFRTYADTYQHIEMNQFLTYGMFFNDIY